MTATASTAYSRDLSEQLRRLREKFTTANGPATASAQALFGSEVAGVVRSAWNDVGVS